MPLICNTTGIIIIIKIIILISSENIGAKMLGTKSFGAEFLLPVYMHCEIFEFVGITFFHFLLSITSFN